MSAEQLNRMETELTTLATTVAVLVTDVAVLKTDVAELKTDVASLHRSAIRHEGMHDGIRLLAEGLAALDAKMDRGFQDLRTEMRELLAPIAGLVAGHSRQLLDHEGRISAVEARRV